MKRNFTSGIFGAMLLLLGTSATAQTTLLVGHRGNGTSGEGNLEVIDTTGGFTIGAPMALSTDLGTDVEGLYGMALEPFTSEIYCVYGTDGGGSSDRRLGILDPSDASIEDIGLVGTVNDITFLDSTLIGSTGDAGSYTFGWINKSNATYTVIGTHVNTGASNAMTYDYFNNQFLKSTQGASNYEVIDPITFDQTSVSSSSGHPGWTTTLLPINDSTVYSMGNDFANVLNTNTFAYSMVGSFTDNEYLHSSVFTSYPLSLWVNGKRLACADEGVELVIVSGDGASSYEWYLDGDLIDGATESTYDADETGTYWAVVDGQNTNPVDIEIIDINEPTFVFSENPAYLGGAATVDVTCYETATGDGFEYSWDSGDGDMSTDENPTFSYGAGTYDVELTVTDNLSGCTGTVTQTLEVLEGSLGINELEVNFNLFPVPATDVIAIQYNGAESYNVQLVDIKGGVISNHIITPNGENKIDINELPAGTYFVNITNGTQTAKRKFVKQ